MGVIEGDTRSLDSGSNEHSVFARDLISPGLHRILRWYTPVQDQRRKS